MELRFQESESEKANCKQAEKFSKSAAEKIEQAERQSVTPIMELLKTLSNAWHVKEIRSKILHSW